MVLMCCDYALGLCRICSLSSALFRALLSSKSLPKISQLPGSADLCAFYCLFLEAWQLPACQNPALMSVGTSALAREAVFLTLLINLELGLNLDLL